MKTEREPELKSCPLCECEKVAFLRVPTEPTSLLRPWAPEKKERKRQEYWTIHCTRCSALLAPGSDRVKLAAMWNTRPRVKVGLAAVELAMHYYAELFPKFLPAHVWNQKRRRYVRQRGPRPLISREAWLKILAKSLNGCPP